MAAGSATNKLLLSNRAAVVGSVQVKSVAASVAFAAATAVQGGLQPSKGTLLSSTWSLFSCVGWMSLPPPLGGVLMVT